MKCSVPGCERLAAVRGMCQAHYQRWWRNGDVKSGEPIARAVGLKGGMSLVMRPDWNPNRRNQLAALAERAERGMSLTQYEAERARILEGKA